MRQPPAIITKLLSLIENEPGKTCHELVLLGGLSWHLTKRTLARMVLTEKLVRRYSTETLEQIFFLPGEPSANYHPETLAEARIQQARFKARVRHYVATKILGE